MIKESGSENDIKLHLSDDEEEEEEEEEEYEDLPLLKRDGEQEEDVTHDQEVGEQIQNGEERKKELDKEAEAEEEETDEGIEEGGSEDGPLVKELESAAERDDPEAVALKKRT